MRTLPVTLPVTFSFEKGRIFVKKIKKIEVKVIYGCYL